jgi:hypothetical protein
MILVAHLAGVKSDPVSNDKSASRNQSPQVLLHAGNSDPVPKLAREPVHQREIHHASSDANPTPRPSQALPYSSWPNNRDPLPPQSQGLHIRPTPERERIQDCWTHHRTSSF